jgi:hypothetical protein
MQLIKGRCQQVEYGRFLEEEWVQHAADSEGRDQWDGLGCLSSWEARNSWYEVPMCNREAAVQGR